MYAAVRRFRGVKGTADEIVRRVREGFIPIVSGVRGFRAYYVIDCGRDGITSVSLYQDRAGAELSTRLSAGWVRENLAALLPNPPEVVSGEVRVESHRAPAPVPSGVGPRPETRAP